MKKVWSIDETIGYGHQNLKHWILDLGLSVYVWKWKVKT